MALITGSDVLGTAFTPGVGDFVMHVSGAFVALQRRAADDGQWVPVESGVLGPGAYDATQRVTGVDWRFVAIPGAATPTVRADQ